MLNAYSRQWFEVFLDTMPDEWTMAEVQGVCDRLPQPRFRRVLDICCGPGRHAAHLVDAGYEVTGVDRDVAAIEKARSAVPAAEFVVLDQRDLDQLAGPFDAAVILWQSFGYFDPVDNDAVLASIARLLRPGGRLLIDLFHHGYFERHQGRSTEVRDPRCSAITNVFDGRRLTSTIEYSEGTAESMNFELFTPDDIAARSARVGFRELERCCWWDKDRDPDPEEQRFQIVLEKG